MKTPGCLKDPLSYLRILTICTVLSTGSLISSMVNPTSEESTFGNYENLEVKLGELEVKATGRNTTEVLMNLMRNAVELEITPSSKEKYFHYKPQKEELILKKHVNSFSTMS